MQTKEILTPTASAPSTRTQDFALVIGVDHYPRFRSLSGAVNDARDLHAWICDPDGGGVAPANARLVESTLAPSTPIQKQLDAALHELLDVAGTAGGGRRFYFTFSGHGASSIDDDRDVALLLATWSRGGADLPLSSEKYRLALLAMRLFDEIVVLLDCCRTSVVDVLGASPGFSSSPRDHAQPPRMMIAYATEHGTSAFESREADRWQGLFTRRLLDILRHSPHGVTARELESELRNEPLAPGQEVEVRNTLTRDSRFGTRGRPPRIEVEFLPGTTFVRVLDVDGNVVHHSDGPSPWLVELEAGLYQVVNQAGTSKPVAHKKYGSTKVVI